MKSFISDFKMSESDSSDCEQIERVSSLKSIPKSFDKVPDDMDFKLKLKTEATTQKLIYRLKKGSALPYTTNLKGWAIPISIMMFGISFLF